MPIMHTNSTKPQGVELHFILNTPRSFLFCDPASLVDEEVPVPESSHEPIEVLHLTLTGSWLALLDYVIRRSVGRARTVDLGNDKYGICRKDFSLYSTPMS